ncbi:hypothetical protein [Mycobacterium sp. AZCC_0083]|uniref:hypothetical protein n=1 Tax=Mycobacterium sp. AZCC_0083 TaxID=2735882 RepID=UPI00160780A2|nr:hypothetical protein [Mycobacterium sp. AZCC_0083]MBB5161172.1 hypothetical protein [Mycobacterium sp. AZCC_0083]
MPCPYPPSQLAPIHPTQERPDRTQRRRFSLGQLYPGPDPPDGGPATTGAPTRRNGTRSPTPASWQPPPTHRSTTAPLTPARYQSLPLTIQRPAANPYPVGVARWVVDELITPAG